MNPEAPKPSRPHIEYDPEKQAPRGILSSEEAHHIFYDLLDEITDEALRERVRTGKETEDDLKHKSARAAHRMRERLMRLIDKNK